jgi:hypothetical protein
MARRTRQIILPTVLKELERHSGQAVTADKIAGHVKLDARDVRISLQNYVHGHPDGCVEKIATGIYRWNCDAPNTSAKVESKPELEPEGPPRYGTPQWDDAILGTDAPTIVVHTQAGPRTGIQFEDVTEDPGLKFLHKSPGTVDDEPSYYFTDKRGSVWRAYKV